MKHSSGLHVPPIAASFVMLACDTPPDKLKKESAEAEPHIKEPQLLPSHGDVVVAKLDQIIIPIIDFEDTSIEEVVDYLRVQSIELDPEKEPKNRGVSFVIRRPRTSEESKQIRNNLQAKDLPRLTYQAVDIRLSDALVEICKRTNLDAFITSHGVILCEGGAEPEPTIYGKKFEIWHKLTPDPEPEER